MAESLFNAMESDRFDTKMSHQQDQRHQNGKQPLTAVAGLFNYQASLLAQHYGKQATNSLDKILNRDEIQRSNSQLQKQKDFEDLQKAVRFLAIYSSIFHDGQPGEAGQSEPIKASKDLEILLDRESQSELPSLIEQAFSLGNNLLQTQHECDMEADKLFYWRRQSWTQSCWTLHGHRIEIN